MKKDEIRSSLKEYINDEERYRKFIYQIRKSKHQTLKYWQEKLLSEYSDNVGVKLSTSELIEAFNICELHEIEFEIGRVKVHEGHIDVRHNTEKLLNTYPNYLPKVINGRDEVKGKYVDFEYCSLCNRAYYGA